MESEIKTKQTINKTANPNTVNRVLNYESSDSKNLLPYLTFEPSHKGQYFKPNDDLDRDDLDFPNPTSPQLVHNIQNNSPARSAIAFSVTPAKNNFPQMKFASRRSTNTGFSDSPFPSFCKDLQFSPGPESMLLSKDLSKEAVPEQSFKNISGLSNTNSDKKESDFTPPTGKKQISKLDLHDQPVLIKSNRNKINIHFQERSEEDKIFENDNLDFSLHCNEDFIGSSPMNFMRRQQELNLYTNLEVQKELSDHRSPMIFPKEDPLDYGFGSEFGELKTDEYFTPHKLKRLEEDLPLTPSIPKSSNQKIVLETLNSFSGQKSHMERMKKKNSLNCNHNDDSCDSFNKKDQSEELAEPKEVKKKIVCNCKKSKCLKLYCDCFAAGESCGKDCNCVDCCNNEENTEERNAAMESTRERNPTAFKPKVNKIETPAKIAEGDAGRVRHLKGCNCKKSGCQKKYCECYQAGIKCSEVCKCEGCKNIDPLAMAKRARTYGLANFGSQESYGFRNENSQSSCFDSIFADGYPTKYRSYPGPGYARDMEEIFYEDENDEDGTESKKKPQHIANFNGFRTSDLLSEIISPKTKEMAENQIVIKLKKEDKNSKKEDLVSKPEKKRKKVKIEISGVPSFSDSNTQRDESFENTPSPRRRPVSNIKSKKSGK